MREGTHCTISRNLRPRCAARTSSSGRKRDAAVRSVGGGGAGTLVSRGAWLVVVMSTQIVEVVVRVGRWVEDDVNFVNKTVRWQTEVLGIYIRRGQSATRPLPLWSILRYVGYYLRRREASNQVARCIRR